MHDEMRFFWSPEVLEEMKKVKKKLATFVFRDPWKKKSQEHKGFHCDEMVMIICLRETHLSNHSWQ